MRCLITGAAGFIGGHLAEALLEEGWQVTGIDAFEANYDPQIKRKTASRLQAHPNFTFVEGDIRDAATVARALSPAPGLICHLAARVGVRASLEDARGYAAVNLGGSVEILEGARRAGVTRIIMASSSSVYGTSPACPFREEDPLGTPLSPYAATKSAMEQLAGTYSHLYDMRVALLRFFTVYGPRQRPDLAIHKFALSIAQGRPIPVFGDGSSRRDYTHISDIITGIKGAIEWTEASEGARGESRAFNLASGRTISLSEMIHALEVALGKEAIQERLPMQPGDMLNTWGDVTRARAELGYPHEPLSFEEGVRDFIRWLNP